MEETDATEETRVILARAANAAKKVLRGRQFRGKSCYDYALDAWIYNEERGLSHDFTSRRAQFLVIEDIRTWYGRDTYLKRKSHRKARAKMLPADPTSHMMRSIPCRSQKREELELSHIDHERFRFICECLAEGKTKEYAAKILGVSPTRVWQIIEKEKWRLGYDNP